MNKINKINEKNIIEKDIINKILRKEDFLFLLKEHKENIDYNYVHDSEITLAQYIALSKDDEAIKFLYENGDNLNIIKKGKWGLSIGETLISLGLEEKYEEYLSDEDKNYLFLIKPFRTNDFSNFLNLISKKEYGLEFPKIIENKNRLIIEEGSYITQLFDLLKKFELEENSKMAYLMSALLAVRSKVTNNLFEMYKYVDYENDPIINKYLLNVKIDEIKKQFEDPFILSRNFLNNFSKNIDNYLFHDKSTKLLNACSDILSRYTNELYLLKTKNFDEWYDYININTHLDILKTMIKYSDILSYYNMESCFNDIKGIDDFLLENLDINDCNKYREKRAEVFNSLYFITSSKFTLKRDEVFSNEFSNLLKLYKINEDISNENKEICISNNILSYISKNMFLNNDFISAVIDEKKKIEDYFVEVGFDKNQIQESILYGLLDSNHHYLLEFVFEYSNLSYADLIEYAGQSKLVSMVELYIDYMKKEEHSLEEYNDVYDRLSKISIYNKPLLEYSPIIKDKLIDQIEYLESFQQYQYEFPSIM